MVAVEEAIDPVADGTMVGGGSMEW